MFDLCRSAPVFDRTALCSYLALSLVCFGHSSVQRSHEKFQKKPSRPARSSNGGFGKLRKVIVNSEAKFLKVIQEYYGRNKSPGLILTGSTLRSVTTPRSLNDVLQLDERFSETLRGFEPPVSIQWLTQMGGLWIKR